MYAIDRQLLNSFDYLKKTKLTDTSVIDQNATIMHLTQPHNPMINHPLSIPVPREGVHIWRVRYLG